MFPSKPGGNSTAQDRYAEADQFYQRALVIYEKAPGKDHPEVARILENIAEYGGKMGRKDEKVYAMYYDAKFPWVKQGQRPIHACPDAFNPVVFELEIVDE